MGQFSQAMYVGIGSKRNQSQPLRNQAGVALVLVLWMLVLLTAIAQNLSFSSRTDLLAARNRVAQARAEAYADAAIYRAVYLLSANPIATAAAMPADPLRWKADGLIREWRYQDSDMRISIVGESGKIDINSSAPPLLVGLFVSMGVGQPGAEALVDAILDWRDSDDLRRLHGAEKAEYLDAGLHHVPANTDFFAIDELQQVLGMNSALFRRIEPFITVHSYQTGIDASVAPREVLLAVPNVTPEQVDSFLAQRQLLLEQGLPPTPFAPAQAFAASSNNSIYSIRVDVVLSDNIRFSRQAVARLGGSSNEPVSFMAWRAPTYTSAHSSREAEESDHDGNVRRTGN